MHVQKKSISCTFRKQFTVYSRCSKGNVCCEIFIVGECILFAYVSNKILAQIQQIR
jgi:hypothetical protein